ncbi:unnamed protein product, partial [Amoebophrya sp. A25]
IVKSQKKWSERKATTATTTSTSKASCSPDAENVLKRVLGSGGDRSFSTTSKTTSKGAARVGVDDQEHEDYDHQLVLERSEQERLAVFLDERLTGVIKLARNTRQPGRGVPSSLLWRRVNANGGALDERMMEAYDKLCSFPTGGDGIN